MRLLSQAESESKNEMKHLSKTMIALCCAAVAL